MMARMVLLLDVGLQAHGITHDGAVRLEACHAVLYRAARHAELLGQGGDGFARIAAQQSEEPMIEVVHRRRYLFRWDYAPVENSSKSPNAIGDLINRCEF